MPRSLDPMRQSVRVAAPLAFLLCAAAFAQNDLDDSYCGSTGTNFSALLGSPVTLYFAKAGYRYTGRVKVLLDESRINLFISARIFSRAVPLSALIYAFRNLSKSK